MGPVERKGGIDFFNENCNGEQAFLKSKSFFFYIFSSAYTKKLSQLQKSSPNSCDTSKME